MGIVMFDSVNLDQIPGDAPAVAGYTSGNWPTWAALAARWPNAHSLSIAVTAAHDAECLDVEQGDATPDQAPAWIRRQQARGIPRPVVYTSISAAQHLIDVLAKAGIGRSAVRLWTAHYTRSSHLCGPGCHDPSGRTYGLTSTADATQWTDRSLGRNLDESIAADTFFAPAAIPTPIPTPVVVYRAHLGGQPVSLIDVTIPTDAQGRGDASAPAGFLAVSDSGAHDVYDGATHDPNSLVIAVGSRPSAGGRLLVVDDPRVPNTTVTAPVLIADAP